MKSLQFLSLLLRRPDEALGRLEGVYDNRLERLRSKRGSYSPLPFRAVLEDLGKVLSCDCRTILQESALGEIEEEIRRAIAALPPNAPFGLYHNADLFLARLCYVVARALRPANAVETGVCYGVTSSFLLQALRVNGRGTLHSIDLPALGRDADRFVGIFVPERLRANWQLHRGPSKSLLPVVLQSASPVDFFIHDSLHTYRNIRRELGTVSPHLSPVAAVVSDDIERNRAFQEWAQQMAPAYCGVLQPCAKQGLIGVAVLEGCAGRDGNLPGIELLAR